MGLIKTAFNAAKQAVKGTMEDQFKEAIRCNDMTNEILMMKKTTPTGVITNKSTIIVAPGQCAIIYDNGKVIDATAEDGIYTFDTSSTPSFFAGQFGETFKEMWERFSYGGGTAKEQAVFFFNIKEILDNKFGTPVPIPFQDWSHPIPNQMTNTLSPLRVEIKCFGKYTFSIINPAVFMEKLAGTADVYRKSQVEDQLRSEVLAVFQNVTNELGTEKYKIPVLEMPSQTDEIRAMMDEKVFDEKIRERGLKIESFAVESVTLDDESEKKIDDYELSSNAYMQQGRMVDAYAEAVKSAAENKNGAMNGFMGIGMMNMTTGNAVNNFVQGAWNNTENSRIDLSKKTETQTEQNQENNVEQKETMQETETTEGKPDEELHVNDEWTCECGTKNSGNFCQNCGKPKARFCKKCNLKLSDDVKFCPNCGEKAE